MLQPGRPAPRCRADVLLVDSRLDPVGHLARLLVERDPNLRPTERPTMTRRECEVLTLIADGLENQQVADELIVSVETVRTHVKGILRKLSARDRTHAVSLAYRSELLLGRPAVFE
jgi:DNA-binding NarL/FixJ family response regulator